MLKQGMLDSLKELEYISLRGNNLGRIAAFSEAQVKLEYIDLSENKLEKFEHFTFRHLNNLRHLNLAHNKLKGP